MFVGMAGKLTKLAAGVLMTHWTRSEVDTAPPGRADRGRRAAGRRGRGGARRPTRARHAYELWEAAGVDRAPDLLCAEAAADLRAYVNGAASPSTSIMVDFEGAHVVGASPGARDRVAPRRRCA